MKKTKKLKKQIILKLATDLLEKEIHQKLADEKELLKPSKYYTSLKEGKFVLKDNKIEWISDDLGSIDGTYPAQVCEIERLLDNRKALEKLANSKKVSNYTKKYWIAPYREFIENALDVYQQGKDNSEFDKLVVEMNDHIADHIVFRLRPLPHKTFRVATSKEIAVQYCIGDYYIGRKLAVLNQINRKLEQELKQSKEEKTL